VFNLSHNTQIDPDVARDLAIITDEVFDRDQEIDVANAFGLLLADRPTEPVVMTMMAALSRLLGRFTLDEADRPYCELTDGLADIMITRVWQRDDHRLLARAILRTVIDDGDLDDLDEESWMELSVSPRANILVTLAELVTGMSAVTARNNDDPHAGDPLRELLGVVG
jgi:hypothetical protein